jgi:transcription elongation factor GreA-like protein
VNTHKKLIGMGFKKCEPHIKHYDNNKESIYGMIPDVYVNEYKIVNSKRTLVTVKKVHPKWRLFYKMVFTDTVNIWIDTDKGQIKTIWLEGNIAKNGVEEIYEFYKHGSILLESKKDIIRLFPKAIQRDFIINDLFK